MTDGDDDTVTLSDDEAAAIANDCRMASALLKATSDALEAEDGTYIDLSTRLKAHAQALEKILHGEAPG
jgi:hypothetical protein